MFWFQDLQKTGSIPWTSWCMPHTHATEVTEIMVEVTQMFLQCGDPPLGGGLCSDRATRLCDACGNSWEQNPEPNTAIPTAIQRLWKLKGDYKIELEPEAKEYALSTPRRVAIPLMKAVKAELQRIEELWVIVQSAGIVVVPMQGVLKCENLCGLELT